MISKENEERFSHTGDPRFKSKLLFLNLPTIWPINDVTEGSTKEAPEESHI